MLRNKDRKLARNIRIQSRAIADATAETDTNAQALLTAAYDFNGWVSGLTDEGIIDGIEALEHDLARINDLTIETQNTAAEIAAELVEARRTLRDLKTRRINRAKEQGGKRWKRLKTEEAEEC